MEAPEIGAYVNRDNVPLLEDPVPGTAEPERPATQEVATPAAQPEESAEPAPEEKGEQV